MVDVIDARALAEAIDRGERPTLVDARPRRKFESWRIPGAVNYPFGPRETLDEERVAEAEALADRDERVVTVCGKGVRCVRLALELAGAGYRDVATVTDGMRGWIDLYERAEYVHEAVRVVQFQRRGTGCLSYLVGSAATGEAVVIDPSRHVDQYLAAAAEHGFDVVAVLDTHVHDDHYTGAHELTGRLDVPYYVGVDDRAAAETAGRRLGAGPVVSLGGTTVEALSTPGHTPGHVSLRLGDAALFAGDLLSLDGVGRPGRPGATGARAGVRALRRSLETAFDELPGGLSVFPAHVALDRGRWRTGTPGTVAAARLETVRGRLGADPADEEAFVSWAPPASTDHSGGRDRLVRANRRGDGLAPAAAPRLEAGPNGNIV